MSNPWSDISGDFQIAENTITFTGTAAQQLCKQDPTRWGLIFANPAGGTGAVFVGTKGNIQTQQGFPVSLTNPPLWLNGREHGGAVQVAWFGFGAGGSSVTVLEIFYRPGEP